MSLKSKRNSSKLDLHNCSTIESIRNNDDNPPIGFSSPERSGGVPVYDQVITHPRSSNNSMLVSISPRSSRCMAHMARTTRPGPLSLVSLLYWLAHLHIWCVYLSCTSASLLASIRLPPLYLQLRKPPRFLVLAHSFPY